jgi:hypothetical protein
MIALRKANPALYTDKYQPLLSDPQRGLLAFKRWSDNGNTVVVAANLCNEPAGQVEIPLDGIEDGTWRESVYGYDVQAEGGVLRDVLHEAEAKVYVKQ